MFLHGLESKTIQETLRMQRKIFTAWQNCNHLLWTPWGCSCLPLLLSLSTSQSWAFSEGTLPPHTILYHQITISWIHKPDIRWRALWDNKSEENISSFKKRKKNERSTVPHTVRVRNPRASCSRTISLLDDQSNTSFFFSPWLSHARIVLQQLLL